MLRALGLCLVLLAACAPVFGAGPPVEGQSLPVSPLVIETAAGPQRFTVELALTPREQEIGLMFRRSLAEDAGMLFDYGRADLRAMWMENTYVPLDMIFIGQDARIVFIAADTEPLSRAIIAAPVPARAVLELNAGTAARLQLRPGDLVRHAVFGNAP